ncbi:CLUMA_CG006789, isoform A, partial [Clunio marinus]
KCAKSISVTSSFCLHSCLLRCASQSSLDESSQKIPRQRSTTGTYKNDAHTNRSFDTMNEMRKQNLLCDVVLVAEGMEIPAHKMILASCSPYFYAMFTGFEESKQDRITIQGVDFHALQLLVEYVYSSVVVVTEENVQVLLTAANLLQLTDVRDACCDYLQSQLDPSNCLGIREFADIHGCIDLFNYADSYIEQHFSEVVQFDEFLTLSSEQVETFVKSDSLSVPSEERIFECVVAWIQFEPSLRQQYLGRLMQYVRLPLLSQDYILQRVEKEPLLQGDIQCKDLIIEALKYHLLKNEQKLVFSFNTPRTIPRRPIGRPKVLLVIGGQAPKAIRSVECYDLRDEKWYQAAELPSRRCRAGLAVLGDKVYAVGGFNGSLRVRTVDVYDPSTDQWTSCCSMEARRSTLGVAVLNSCIYAVGGFDGSTGLNSAEVFDPKSQEWRLIATMSTRRSSVGVGVLNGLLFAVGGYDGSTRQCLASVECYNPLLDSWSCVAEMSARRSGAGVGVVNGLLYAVGGHDGPLVRKSVEAYNADTNQWHQPAQNHYANVDVAQQQQQQQPLALGVPAPLNEPNVAQIINLQHHRANYHQSYRNDVYDVPRNVRNNNNNNFYVNVPNGNQRRSNLHLDFNRPRYPTNYQKHQRSFDDTESCYGYVTGSGSGSSNQGYPMYERIGGTREEPLYQNSGMYGRLDVIGHGIGRIERHLSSSCGNIDHYNVGGHYAVLSHSHVGQMVMNANANNSSSSTTAQNSRDGVKSFFSCLNGESSQSLSNINGIEGAAASSVQTQNPPTPSLQRSTGAIPKTKNKQSNKVSPKPSTSGSSVASSSIPPIPPPMPTNNRISKSSLQYLLLNKWLPLGPDYKIIDFNFMFSRNCSSTGQCDAGEGVVQFNGQAEMVDPGIYQPQREYPTMNPTNYPRVIRNTPQLSRLRESDAENLQHDSARGGNAFRARSESPSFSGGHPKNPQEDPFRNWSFNFENNSFRPAGGVTAQKEIKRITEGTLAMKDFQEQPLMKDLPSIVIDNQDGTLQESQQQQPTTSKSTSPSTISDNSGASTSASSSSQGSKPGEMKKSENYDNLASLQQDAPCSSSTSNGIQMKQRKKKSTESQSSTDSVTLAEEDEDVEDAFEELESDVD